MDKVEALKMLESAPQGENFSKVNHSLTQKQVVEIIRKAVESQKDGELNPMLEKRVYQVCRNQRRPRY